MAISRSNNCRRRESARRHQWTIWKRSFQRRKKKELEQARMADQTATPRRSK